MKKTLEHAGRTWYILLFTFYFLSAPASCTPHHVSFYFLPAPCILHPTPHTLHPAQFIFTFYFFLAPHTTLHTMYLVPCNHTPHPTPVHFYFIPNTLHPASHTLRTFSSLLFTAPPPPPKKNTSRSAPYIKTTTQLGCTLWVQTKYNFHLCQIKLKR